LYISYFVGQLNFEQKFRPEIWYPASPYLQYAAFGLAGYPAKSVSGACPLKTLCFRDTAKVKSSGVHGEGGDTARNRLIFGGADSSFNQEMALYETVSIYSTYSSFLQLDLFMYKYHAPERKRNNWYRYVIRVDIRAE
jgi:hypothetical protein